MTKQSNRARKSSQSSQSAASSDPQSIRPQTMADLKAQCKAIGNHFFDPDTMMFFRSRVESELIVGEYFITSEQFVSVHTNRVDPRKYTIRRVSFREDGSMSFASIPDFQQFDSLKAAHAALGELLAAQQPSAPASEASTASEASAASEASEASAASAATE